MLGEVVPFAPGHVRVLVRGPATSELPAVGMCHVENDQILLARLSVSAMRLLLPRTGEGTRTARSILEKLASRADLRPRVGIICANLFGIREELDMLVNLQTLEAGLSLLSRISMGVGWSKKESIWVLDHLLLETIRIGTRCVEFEIRE